jgi:hypothetical protein
VAQKLRRFTSPELWTILMTLLGIYTIIHVIISLIGILSGAVVLLGLLGNQRLAGWTKVFLWTTVLTSVTGFFFPAPKVLPSHITGIISLALLALAIYARYPRQMAGAWRKVYVITGMLAFYLNVFVLIVQSFLKIPALTALAPTQNEPPFQITQLVVLVIFLFLIVLAAIRFKGEPGKA